MRNLNINVIDAHAIASNNSAAIAARQIYAASFIGTFSITDAAGTLKIQASNWVDPGGQLAPNNIPESSWIDIPNATATIASGVAANVPMPVSISYQWLRANWVRSGGTGTITVAMNAQGF